MTRLQDRIDGRLIPLSGAITHLCEAGEPIRQGDVCHCPNPGMDYHILPGEAPNPVGIALNNADTDDKLLVHQGGPLAGFRDLILGDDIIAKNLVIGCAIALNKVYIYYVATWKR